VEFLDEEAVLFARILVILNNINRIKRGPLPDLRDDLKVLQLVALVSVPLVLENALLDLVFLHLLCRIHLVQNIVEIHHLE
jgi:hypothetical protein